MVQKSPEDRGRKRNEAIKVAEKKEYYNPNGIIRYIKPAPKKEWKPRMARVLEERAAAAALKKKEAKPQISPAEAPAAKKEEKKVMKIKTSNGAIKAQNFASSSGSEDLQREKHVSVKDSRLISEDI